MRSFVVAVSLCVVMIIFGMMYALPLYHVWQQRLAGEAALAGASMTRQIAQYDAQAEVARARGLAQANRILGQSLQGQEGERYLRYLYIDALKNHEGSVIYVPTEAGLPILEAGHRP